MGVIWNCPSETRVSSVVAIAIHDLCGAIALPIFRYPDTSLAPVEFALLATSDEIIKRPLATGSFLY